MPQETFPQEIRNEVQSQSIGGLVVDVTEKVTSEPPILDNGSNAHDVGRWDHDKAETLAAVIQESPSIYPGIKPDRDDSAKEVIDNSFLKLSSMDTDAYAKRVIAESEDRIREEQEYVDSNPGSNNLGDLQLLEERHSRITKNFDEYVRERKKEVHDKMVKKVDEELRPFEELYDFNPELFAAMPVSDFIDKVKGLVSHNYNLMVAEWAKRRFDTQRKKIEQALENKDESVFYGNEGVNSIDALDAYLAIIDGTENPNVSVDELKEEIQRLPDLVYDRFEDSIKTRCEKYIKFLDVYCPQIESELDRRKQMRGDYLNQFRP